MQSLFRLFAGVAAILSVSVPALAQDAGFGRFDFGKMWTFERPPGDHFLEAYGLEAGEEWFRRARLGALRIPGCSASFVSPHGLVLTNHHCARAAVASVTEENEHLLDEGFVARSLAEERHVEGFVADRLVEIVDVTGKVDTALAMSQTEAERAAALTGIAAAIEDSLESEWGSGHVVELIPLYHGGLYSAYVFRRFDDVRLVMAPELRVGYFGGDADNFTYPRYALDFSLLRVYVEGQPLETEYFFPWSEAGVGEGEPVFAIGNPGSTFRLETVAQLEYRRDVLDAQLLRLVDTRLEAMEAFAAERPEQVSTALRNRIFALRNAQKLYQGRLKALRSAEVIGRKADAETAFAAAMSTDESLNSRFGGLLDRMAGLQDERRESAAEAGAFLRLDPDFAYNSALERRALRVAEYLATGSDDSAALLQALSDIEDIPHELDVALLEARLGDFEFYLDEGGESLGAAADVSPLKSAASLRAAVEAGEELAGDPLVRWASGVRERLADHRSAAAGFSARQEALAAALGRARFEVYGTTVPPDATFSLRISDGMVRGYPFNGTQAAAFTTFFGLFDRHFSHSGDPEWALPDRWLESRSRLDMTARVNFVSTADITGGNSGSPVVNRNLELVGLIFDGNIESLSGDFIYLDAVQRSVAVDVRGILEALSEVYEADGLVSELTSGSLVQAEEEPE